MRSVEGTLGRQLPIGWIWEGLPEEGILNKVSMRISSLVEENSRWGDQMMKMSQDQC